MPPKAPPKVYQILIRSHKLTIFLTRTPDSTIKDVKDEIQSALSSDVVTSVDLPQIASFEVCKLMMRGDSREYQLLDDAKQLKDAGINNWDDLYLQFRDSSTGELREVECTLPPTEDVEPEPEPESDPEPEAPVRRKRKADEMDQE